jgi:hypothetical protein
MGCDCDKKAGARQFRNNRLVSQNDRSEERPAIPAFVTVKCRSIKCPRASQGLEQL